jgi:hypothetical protein
VSDAPQTFPGDCTEEGRIVFDLPAQVTAYCRARFAGARVDVEIRLRKDKRSDRQNRAFHAALARWSEHIGHYPVEKIKDELLGLQWGYIVAQSPITGEITKRLVKPHTSRLNTAEFAELFDLAAIEAAKTGHVMVMPDEFLELKKKRGKAA